MSFLTRLFTADAVVYSVILLNAAIMLALGFLPADAPTADLCRGLEMGCVSFFALEAAFKIRTLGWKTYWVNGWNRFDFWVTLFSLPTLAAPLLPNDFRIVTLLRLGRLFRLFRLLHMIPNREHLVKGVIRAIRASVGIFLALFLINFVLALGATFLFRDSAPEYFGNPALANYTIFKVLTLEGWHEIPDLMVGDSSDAWWQTGVRLFFIFTVLVCGILGLSMANAVFVDEMVMDNNDPLENKIDALTAEIAALRAMIATPRAARGGEPPLARWESPE